VSHTDTCIQTFTDSEIAPDSVTSPQSLADKVCRHLVNSTLRSSPRDFGLALFAHQADTNRPFQLHKRSQLFICPHNETLSVAAMRVCNPDRSPAGIDR
jgi:hypothetical protein